MNLTGYKKHLKEIKRLLEKEENKKDHINKTFNIRSLERAIKDCQKKIKKLQNKEEVHVISSKFKDHTKLINKKKGKRKHKK